MKFKEFLNKIIEWRLRNVSDKTFLILIAIIVGLIAGLAAIALKMLVHGIQHLLHRILENPSFNFLLFVFPLIGILLTVVYVQRFHKGKIGKGVGSILVSIAKGSSIISSHKSYSHLISSALTVGFGGSAGLEAPIVITGAAIGSNTARDLKMSVQERTLLLACGVAAGISAIFNSPIAGVLFAVEVILSEFTVPAFIPILISSATASVLTNFLSTGQLFFLITKGWNMSAIPFYVLLGMLMGIISVYVTRMAIGTEALFKKSGNPYKRAIRGGILLGLMILLFPALYGEGYYTIEHLLRGNYLTLTESSIFTGFSTNVWFVVLIGIILFLVKIIATSITIGSGGNGGIFAPSLFIGALTGFVFAHTINLLGIAELSEQNFIVAAMAGALSGVVHAPLTGIFLIAEITGGYVLFVPLMIVSSMSFLIARYFEPHSIYARKLVEHGLHEKNADSMLLNRIKLKNLIKTDYPELKESMTLGQLVQVIQHSRHNVFPVLNEKKNLTGIVSLENVREVMFQSGLYEKIRVSELMKEPPCMLDINDNMAHVMKKFDYYDVWILPVNQNGVFAGFISRSVIFSKYRNLLILQSAEGHTERTQ